MDLKWKQKGTPITGVLFFYIVVKIVVLMSEWAIAPTRSLG